jgi:hypothetical protein
MADIGTLTPEQMLQQQQILRQQKMAEMLMQRPAPQGQMIGNRYVAPSFTQNLANLANLYVGKEGIEKADQAQLDMAKAIRQGDIAATADFMETKQGKPAVEGGIYSPTGELTKQTTADMFGSDMALNPQYKQIASVAAVPANPQAAYANLYADPRASARLQNMAFTKMNEGPIKASLDDVLLNPFTYETIYKGAGKNPEKIQTAAILLGLENKPRSEWTKQERDAIDNKLQQIAQAGAANSGQKDFSNSLSLRKEFNNEPVYKGHQEIKSAWNTINVGLKQASPAGDLAAATKFMKLLDPTSVVRESELLLAMKASGALDRLQNYAQMRVNGTLLTPKQRQDFKSLSDEFYQTATGQYNAKYAEYSDIAKRNNLNPLDIGKPESNIHNSQWGEVKVAN